MLTYKERYDLISDAVFQQRIQYAAWVTALAFANEVPGTVNRRQWAKAALQGALDTDVMRRFAIQVSANQAVGSAGKNALDSDIQAAVDAVASDVAG